MSDEQDICDRADALLASATTGGWSLIDGAAPIPILESPESLIAALRNEVKKWRVENDHTERARMSCIRQWDIAKAERDELERRVDDAVLALSSRESTDRIRINRAMACLAAPMLGKAAAPEFCKHGNIPPDPNCGCGV